MQPAVQQLQDNCDATIDGIDHNFLHKCDMLNVTSASCKFRPAALVTLLQQWTLALLQQQ